MALGFLIRYFLIATLLHCPVPCPDLDGECRGVPIENLADVNAWHVLLIGVKPNDDIDRGPIRQRDNNSTDDPAQSPFGDMGMSLASVSHHAKVGHSHDLGSRFAFQIGLVASISTGVPGQRRCGQVPGVNPPLAARLFSLRI